MGGTGDILSTLPAIQAFSHSYPDAKLTVLTFAPEGELSGNDLLIHRIVCVEKRAKHPHLARQAVVELLSQPDGVAGRLKERLDNEFQALEQKKIS